MPRLLCDWDHYRRQRVERYRGHRSRQTAVPGGRRCQFLQDPLFFVSSLFVKKPSRSQGLLMVMSLALLVYSVAQRRLRQQLAYLHETMPNQINQPTTSPTLRWVFPLLEGIHRVRVTVQGQVYDLIKGLNNVKIKVLRLFGEQVCCLYQLSVLRVVQCRSNILSVPFIYGRACRSTI
jgi:hypothetical protein